MTKVLFVCLGNICRSPLAEAIFDHKVKLRGLSGYSSDSAGTAAYHIGNQPDHRSIQVAEENGVAIDHQARQFRAEDCEEFDYIFAMDKHNYDDIIGMSGYRPENLYLMRDYSTDQVDKNRNVPDPYYGGIDGFNLIFDMMSDAIDNFLDSQEK